MNASHYRLTEIKKYQIILQEEINKRKVLINRCKRWNNIFQGINLASASLTGVLGVSSVVSSMTLIGLPSGVILGRIMVVSGCLSTIMCWR